MGSSSFFDDPTNYEVVDESSAGSSFYGEGPGYAQVDPDAIKHLKDLAEAAAVASETSKVASGISAANSASSAAAAATSAANAATSAAASSVSAANSATEASHAASSAAASFISEQNALASAEASADSADASASSASTAATQAGIATSKASDAASSEANAASSKTAAASSASAASTSETNASASASAASTSETNAASSASAAASSKSLASTSEANAASSASAAATSASNALTSETNAAASALAANSSASSASASAVTASNAAAASEAKLLEFNGIYYGPLSSDPTNDPNGDPVGEGDFYYNSVSKKIRTYNGTIWVEGDVAGDTHAATSKSTPVDADELPLVDSAASNALKRLTWANLKAALLSGGIGNGTVTSVSASVPTGLSVSGSPITTSGTLAVTWTAGYQAYTSTEATKLSGIAAGAQVNLAVGTTSGTVAAGDDSRITGAVQKAGNQTITGGFSISPNNLGTISSFTLNPALGNYQYGTNNGAFTLTAPASDCAVDLLVTNGASAGSVTFSGFTVGSSTGDALTTTNGHKFIVSIRRINSVSTYIIKALQ